MKGLPIGVNQLEQFGLLHFEVVGTRDDSQLVIDLDAIQTAFADGTFIDPNGTLQFTEELVINDAPEVNTIANTAIAESSFAGTVVVAAEDVTASDDQFGDTPTFLLSTVPTDDADNALFAIDSATGEITLTAAGANTIDFESGVTSYTLGVQATDGFKISQEETFTININNNPGDAAIISVDKTAITFGTPLSQFREGATDSDLVRPNLPDTFQFIDITNTADFDVLTLSDIEIAAAGVTIDADFTSEDILLNPGESRRFLLTYAPSAAGEDFELDQGLTVFSNATNNSELAIALAGKSTFNSDISYDGQVNLADLGVLNTRFGSSQGDTRYDSSADITGDGLINLAELAILNVEFGSSIA